MNKHHKLKRACSKQSYELIFICIYIPNVRTTRCDLVGKNFNNYQGFLNSNFYRTKNKTDFKVK